MRKSVIATIRFNRKEMKELERYLRRNPCFDSLSSLGRVATMEFVRTKTALPLHCSPAQAKGNRPWFLWDYDLSEAQLHEILMHAPFEQRKWLLGRMLERLGPNEIVKYLSLEEIRQALPRLRLSEKVKRHWQEAIAIWIHPTPKS